MLFKSSLLFMVTLLAPSTFAIILGDAITATETDFNNVPTGKWYFYNLTGKTNYPSQATSGGVLLSTLTTQGMSFQYYQENVTNAIYFRTRWFSNNWSSWQRIDNYGTSSLTELATALGVPFMGNKIADTGDCNTCYDSTGNTKRVYFNYLTGTVSNAPSETGNYLIVVTVYYAVNDVWQLSCDIVKGKMWFRVKGSTQWAGWKEIATA